MLFIQQAFNDHHLCSRYFGPYILHFVISGFSWPELLSVLQKLFTYSVYSGWHFLQCLFSIKTFWDLVRVSLNIPPWGFPVSSVGKESACNVGDPGLIPGLGRSTGKGIGPLQYFWASLVTQLVKNPPAMQETWFRSLGWEDPLQKGKATLSSILAWRIPRTV